MEKGVEKKTMKLVLELNKQKMILLIGQKAKPSCGYNWI